MAVLGIEGAYHFPFNQDHMEWPTLILGIVNNTDATGSAGLTFTNCMKID